MKIKDIVQEGILDTLGRGIARGFGVEPNDENFMKQQQVQNELKMRPQLPGMAAKQFQQLLSNSGANLADPSSYDANTVKKSLQTYAQQYFASTENREVNDIIKELIISQALPTNLTDKDILQYLSAANKARSDTVDKARAGTLQTISTQAQPDYEKKPNKPTPGPSPEPSKPNVGLPANVSVLASSPMVLQVGKRRFELDDTDQWHPLGSTKTVSPGEAAILNRYLSLL
jgi:hypothetical protein